MRTLSFRWLKSVWTILGSIVLGGATGFMLPSLAEQVAPFGDLYLAFLKMCAIPIMMTAIVSSIGSLFMNRGAIKLIRRMVVVFFIGLLLVSALALIAGMIGQPGSGLSEEAKHVLGSIVNQSEQGSAIVVQDSSERGLLDFLLGLVPSNIFSALGEGNSLQILFFSIIAGATIGIVSTKPGEMLLDLADVAFKAFQKAIAWSMYLLPMGLFCMMADQLSTIGADLFPAIFKLIIWINVASLIVALISIAIIAHRLQLSIFVVFRSLKEVLTIAFGTRNSIASIPSSLHALTNHLKLDAATARLVVPLGMILCRYSMVLIYGLGITFTAQLYDVSLTATQLLTVWVVAALAALAGAGSPALVSISMLALLASPLHLPADTTIILLLAINPLIDPFITSASVLANCAATTLISSDINQVQVQPIEVGEVVHVS
ncbi:MAG: cation:dicarboxylase symporter family transporter [Candidatus Cohnella colombiensis]|uniref:Cation:dicarboxylase symporter family transporter n=1 Tax=Candidatus Cohnella colombiensis TaxID=3121368 RepID=A0AA95JAS4_9BACL|nr:MAG: cation:dicarboxylase symporter family transporter [Cohnella sp.]